MGDREPVVIALRKQKEDEAPKTLLAKMPPCPICGKKAYMMHGIVDGFDFGFDGGCPSFCLNDGKHGIAELSDPKSPNVKGFSYRSVYAKWLNYCKRMKERING